MWINLHRFAFQLHTQLNIFSVNIALIYLNPSSTYHHHNDTMAHTHTPHSQDLKTSMADFRSRRPHAMGVVRIAIASRHRKISWHQLLWPIRPENLDCIECRHQSEENWHQNLRGAFKADTETREDDIQSHQSKLSRHRRETQMKGMRSSGHRRKRVDNVCVSLDERPRNHRHLLVSTGFNPHTWPSSTYCTSWFQSYNNTNNK